MLTDDEVASWLWPRLQRAFPAAVAAVLMPNHLHLVTLATCALSARRKLAQLLGNLSRSSGPGRAIRFEPVPAVQLQHDLGKLLRQARYVVLNPVRAALTGDPLCWKWSTHRDVLGAVSRPWVTARRLASLLGRSASTIAGFWHDYVCRDESVAKSAATVPSPARPTRFAELPLSVVARAVVAATRSRVSDLRRRSRARRLFLSAAPQVGWDQSSRLASFCGMTTRAVQKAKSRPCTRSLAPVMLCLGDARLHG